MWSGFPTVSEMPLGENPLHIYGCLSSLRTPLLLSIPPANPQRSLSLRLSGCPALIHYAGHSHWEWCLLHCFTWKWCLPAPGLVCMPLDLPTPNSHQSPAHVWQC
eukprot:GGOE01009336.1.p4 GENE.GGOE01009336.1~~GGOE01009336.1.p4  ORF type:complete len:105 (+),score=4.39 GGOE01009336.1:724-1038(+)